MSDFYALLKQTLIDRNLRTVEQREEAYAQARTAMIRRLWAFDPPLAEDEIDDRIGQFDIAVERIESDLVEAFAHEAAAEPPARAPLRSPAPPPRSARVTVVDGYDVEADYAPAFGGQSPASAEPVNGYRYDDDDDPWAEAAPVSRQSPTLEDRSQMIEAALRGELPDDYGKDPEYDVPPPPRPPLLLPARRTIHDFDARRPDPRDVQDAPAEDEYDAAYDEPALADTVDDGVVEEPPRRRPAYEVPASDNRAFEDRPAFRRMATRSRRPGVDDDVPAQADDPPPEEPRGRRAAANRPPVRETTVESRAPRGFARPRRPASSYDPEPVEDAFADAVEDPIATDPRRDRRAYADRPPEPDNRGYDARAGRAVPRSRHPADAYEAPPAYRLADPVEEAIAEPPRGRRIYAEEAPPADDGRRRAARPGRALAHLRRPANDQDAGPPAAPQRRRSRADYDDVADEAPRSRRGRADYDDDDDYDDAEDALAPRSSARQARPHMDENRKIRLLIIAVAALAVVLLAISGFVFFTLLSGPSSTTPRAAAAVTSAPSGVPAGTQQTVTLFDGRDPTVFEADPNNPIRFTGTDANGIATISTSTSSSGARIVIGPGLSARLAGQSIRVTLVARSTPGDGAPSLRFAYQSGLAISHWQAASLTKDFKPYTLDWRVPTMRTNPTGDYIVIEPGIPGDGTSADIQSATIDVLGQ